MTQVQADRAFADLNTPLEQHGPDTRTDEQKTLDQHFPAAKPEDYIIRYGLPGQEPEMMKELGVCYVLVAVDQASPRLPANSPADGAIVLHHQDGFPPTQFLARIDIDARLDDPGGKGVPEVMETEPRDPRLAHRRIKCPQ